MSLTARPAAIYDGTGPHVLVAATISPSATASVGDRARLRALIAWCAGAGMSVDALERLDRDDVRMDPASAARVATQLRRAGQVLRAVPVPAVGWSVAGGRGLRGGTLGEAVRSESGALLSEDGATTVTAHLDSAGAYLEVRSAGAQGATLRVTSWSLGDGGEVLVEGAPAPEWAARALGRLCAEGAVVREVPATSVVADLLTTLREMALGAAESATVLRVSSAVDGEELGDA